MLDINEIITQGTAMIDNAKFVTRPSVNDRINIINGIGKKLGIEQMSSEFPDAYRFLKNHLDKKLGLTTESIMNTELDIIKEALEFALNEEHDYQGLTTDKFNSFVNKLQKLNRMSDDEYSWDEIAYYDVINAVKDEYGEEISKAVNAFITTLNVSDIRLPNILDWNESNHPYFQEWFQDAVDKVYAEMVGEGLSESRILSEAPKESIPTSKNISRYEDDDITKIIKQVCKTEFNDFKLTRIAENGGFWSIDVQTELEDMDGDIELKRFKLAKIMADFRSEFFAAISKVLPIVNIKTTPYQFTKNSNKIKFGLVLALSNTNDREWVTGAYKKPDEKAAQGMVDKQTKKEVKEAFAGGLVELGARILKQDFEIAPGVDISMVVEKLLSMGIKANIIDDSTFVAKWSASKFSADQIQAIANGQ